MSPQAIFGGVLTVAVGLVDIVFSFAGALAVSTQFHISISYFMVVFFIIFLSVAWALDRLSSGALSRALWGGHE